jgi:hypothetical protein
MNIKQVSDAIRGLSNPEGINQYTKGRSVSKDTTVKGADGTEYTHEKGRSHPMVDGISDDEMDAINDRKPDASVKTGNSSGEAASDLDIYYHKGNTIVSAGGEAYNTEPWKHPGKVSPEDVLKEYHKAWDPKERKQVFGTHDYSQK